MAESQAAPYSARESQRRAAKVTGIISALGLTPRRGGPTNLLLLTDEVGRGRLSTFDLPQNGFSYGKPSKVEPEGAKEVTMQWVAHTPSRSSEMRIPDFVHFNKRAATANVTNSKDLKYYRQELDSVSGLRALCQNRRLPAKALIPSDVFPDFAYGSGVRPSTPIKQVISGKFANEAEQQLDTIYCEASEARIAGKMHKVHVHFNAASKARAILAKKAQEAPAEELKEFFKLSKFKNVTAKAVAATQS